MDLKSDSKIRNPSSSPLNNINQLIITLGQEELISPDLKEGNQENDHRNEELKREEANLNSENLESIPEIWNQELRSIFTGQSCTSLPRPLRNASCKPGLPIYPSGSKPWSIGLCITGTQGISPECSTCTVGEVLQVAIIAPGHKNPPGWINLLNHPQASLWMNYAVNWAFLQPMISHDFPHPSPQMAYCLSSHLHSPGRFANTFSLIITSNST